jgi:beta-1,4-mannosyl-glycoprotein beta-1,4-N-acetylglucosaminyltransferase
MIVDAFTYNGEDDLLLIRLSLLSKYIDRFVIVEADKTFTGIKKSQKFKPSLFREWESKISYFFINNLVENPVSPWCNEIIQRNSLRIGFNDLNDDDVILLSDLDEIPNPKVIKTFNSEKYIYGCLEQNIFYYRLNLQAFTKELKPVIWDKARITTYKNFKKYFNDLTELRWEKYKGIFRSLKRWHLKNRRQIIKNSGWHFTYMMSPEQIIEKIKSYSHSELNTPDINNIEFIKNAIKSKGLLSGEDYILASCGIENQFPIEISSMIQFKNLY